MAATCLNDITTVILAGGQGTRLRALFPDRPKCLAPIHGVPFLRRYLDWLAMFGARRVILSLGYKADMVQAYVKSETWPGMEIASYVEQTPLGTGGAVRAVLPMITTETALVANGDSITKADLCQFVDFHRRKNARLSVLLTHQPQVSASGLVETDADDAVTSFIEKPSGRDRGGYISAGLYLMQRDAIAEIPDTGPVSIERDVFPRFCGRGFYAFKGRFPFVDIGTPESYRRAAQFFAEEAAA
ncbi:MAG: sugar phosphate nucleotidyltransferase [Verrucomicrobiae bacterium]|nr:sugar phosphate nucleotidyltransferase [Verrucomicrobiae bacterium]